MSYLSCLDKLSQIIWTRKFLLCQGLKLQPARIYQDNWSTIFLATKGRSTSERTRHVKIRYFFIHHFIVTGEVQLNHLAATLMIADLLTKPLHGTLFLEFRNELLGQFSEWDPASVVECINVFLSMWPQELMFWHSILTTCCVCLISNVVLRKSGFVYFPWRLFFSSATWQQRTIHF